MGFEGRLIDDDAEPGRANAGSVRMNLITGIDHPLIAVADMDVAFETYRRLGFTIPPRGSHVEWGTGNWCIMFPDDYLELRGILTTARPLQGLDAWLEAHGEGLMGVAFGTDDAVASRRTLEEHGLGVRRYTTLTRNFEHADGWTRPEFALCFPEEAAIYGLGHVVLCEHRTPDLLRPPGATVHPNGAVRVIGIEGTVADLEAAEAVQRRFLGSDAVSQAGNRLELALPREQRITLRQAAPGEREGLDIVTLQASDVSATRRLFQTNGVRFSDSDDRSTLTVFPKDACGVALRFTGA